MIDPARLEIALIAVARRYAPTAAPPTWARPGDFQTGLPELARRLASEGALVLSAEAQASAVPTDASAYTAWVDTYKSLYTILCRTLFPSFMRIDAFYVDQLQPPIAIVYGECAPVMTALGGYAATAITALTIQNTLGVSGVVATPPKAFRATSLNSLPAHSLSSTVKA